MLAAFDIVLVFVCPVQDNFFSVVRDGVGLAAAITPFGDKVAVLVVAREEIVKVIVDAGLKLFSDLNGLEALLSFLVLLS
jgi:hypothetical protein